MTSSCQAKATQILYLQHLKDGGLVFSPSPSHHSVHICTDRAGNRCSLSQPNTELVKAAQTSWRSGVQSSARVVQNTLRGQGTTASQCSRPEHANITQNTDMQNNCSGIRVEVLHAPTRHRTRHRNTAAPQTRCPAYGPVTAASRKLLRDPSHRRSHQHGAAPRTHSRRRRVRRRR